jgi:hypothetical protein
METQDAITEFSRKYPAVYRDSEALTRFFDEHPEYENRLALFDTPEERYKGFLIDEMWSKWNSLPKITRDEVKDQLGDTFSNAFLSKDTRSYDSIDPLQLQIWLKLLGSDPPGKLTADQRLMLDFNRLELTDPETAWRADVFYENRKGFFPNYYKQQDEYYALPVGTKRREYLKNNPSLKQYWDWRRDFMEKNPDLVPYLTDDEKTLEKYKDKARQEGAIPLASEIPLSDSMKALLNDYQNGQELPVEVQMYLGEIADTYGMSQEQILGVMGIQ